MADRPTLLSYPVWDRSVRWFHWINVLCVVALAAMGMGLLYGGDLGLSTQGKILLKSSHVTVGYVFAVNLAWRLVWAFVGGRRARWRALLPGGPGYAQALRSYVAGVRRGDAPRYAGHNPAGRLAVTALLALLCVQAASGLVIAGTDLYWPPFGGRVAAWVAAPGVDPSTLAPYDKTGLDEAAFKSMRALRDPVVGIHESVFYLLVALIAAHIAAVVLTELREGGALISAMFTGRKLLDRPPVDERD